MSFVLLLRLPFEDRAAEKDEIDTLVQDDVQIGVIETCEVEEEKRR